MNMVIPLFTGRMKMGIKTFKSFSKTSGKSPIHVNFLSFGIGNRFENEDEQMMSENTDDDNDRHSSPTGKDIMQQAAHKFGGDTSSTEKELINHHKYSYNGKRVWADYTSMSAAFNRASKNQKKAQPFRNSSDVPHVYDASAFDKEHPSDDDLNHAQHHIDSTMTPAHKQLTTFSGVRGNRASDMSKMERGDTFHHNGYTSSSLSTHEAHQFARYEPTGHRGPEGVEHAHAHMLHVTTPVGHPVAYVDHVSSTEGEKELIHPRNTLFRHTGKVTKITSDIPHMENDKWDSSRKEFSKKPMRHTLFIHHVEAVHPDEHKFHNHTAFHEGRENG